MASYLEGTWTIKYTKPSDTNNGYEYTTDSQLSVDMFNIANNNAFYAVYQVNNLATQYQKLNNNYIFLMNFFNEKETTYTIFEGTVTTSKKYINLIKNGVYRIKVKINDDFVDFGVVDYDGTGNVKLNYSAIIGFGIENAQNGGRLYCVCSSGSFNYTLYYKQLVII